MGINITQTFTNFQFENRENLRNTAKEILQRQGSSKEAVERVIDKTLFDGDGMMYSNSQLAIIKAASQISLNNPLKETLKYLKSHPTKKSEKVPKLGELWNVFSNNDDATFDEDIIEIDYSLKNIFAAA